MVDMNRVRRRWAFESSGIFLMSYEGCGCWFIVSCRTWRGGVTGVDEDVRRDGDRNGANDAIRCVTIVSEQLHEWGDKK